MKNSDMPISLHRTHAVLGWPTPKEITHPQGAGAAVFAALAREKIGRVLARFGDAAGATVGILVAEPYSDGTQAPLGIVVSFTGPASEQTLRELQRLCWNFSHSPTLITIEPALLRVWSCCEAPDSERELSRFLVHQITSSELMGTQDSMLENLAVRALHWINLVSGEFFQLRSDRFNRDGRADQMLLGNLRYIRQRLRNAGLGDDDICHDLLARIIFVQFLFDRKDSDGTAALTAVKLARLHADGVLSRPHDNFASVLANYEDTYRLFDWLNARFNGDLFPGKGNTAKERAAGWANEKRVITKQHLSLLADFIQGNLDMPSGQGCLWPQYSFDVIPLEFISSIYETFVTEKASRDGIFYTPPPLVDFILDRVLPWNSQKWDVRVIDPACGSGIFLVKAFQRLVHRWKLANGDQPIRAEILRRLLDRNIFGVDKDPHAVRVACFSLYLAMCDEIEPRYYWTQILFPPMRERRLICSDFFVDDRPGFSSQSDSGAYELVIGNAPWGDNLVTETALEWAKADGRAWAIANKDIGCLFLAKAALLAGKQGRIAMIQSANSLLFNGSPTAIAFRRQIFTSCRIEEIYNLSALRFKIFKKNSRTTTASVSPACVVVMKAQKPLHEDRIAYISPKELRPLIDEFIIVIDPQDQRSLTVQEAVTDPFIWSALMWGGPRDKELLRKLKSFGTLSSFSNRFKVKSSRGIEFGNKKRRVTEFLDCRLFDRKGFPTDSSLYINAADLPKAGEMWIHDRESTDFSAFTAPQLLVKRSWQKAIGRFQARLVSSESGESVVCTQSYFSVHAPKELLEVACECINSVVAVYFLQLTSGRLAAYRPEVLIRELRNLPLPPRRSVLSKGLGNGANVDQRVLDAFDLKDAERVLIEDMVNYTLPDFRGRENSVGRRSTYQAGGDGEEAHLKAYCEYVMRVLKAGFGVDKTVTATIFRQKQGGALPYRLVAFELGKKVNNGVSVEEIKAEALIKELERLDLSRAKSSRPVLHNGRHARIYEGSGGSPTIFVVKPDMARYWTRSAGLSDGDEIALDLFRWQQAAPLQAGVRR
jgi:hypothetical protein